MKEKSWTEIKQAISKLNLLEIDFVVAIGRGGIIPGAIIANKEKKNLEILWIKYRDDNNIIIYKEPKILKKTNFSFHGKNILIVDDVARTGKTLMLVKEYLKGAKSIKTLVVNGDADFSLFNEECFKMPWSIC